MSVGVPVKLFHEAENHIITIEVKTGELYRGYLTEAEVFFFSPKIFQSFFTKGYYELPIRQCDSHIKRWKTVSFRAGFLS